ncbi:MAG TPA: enoyl-CoA hydratase-related protein [Candidatus Binatia bacterium]|jgi:enoyl-CoA hydratase/carnithine racemase|nr:enoyl-CoA hydratase-related protein [Candidatus Binatia bacterium]
MSVTNDFVAMDVPETIDSTWIADTTAALQESEQIVVIRGNRHKFCDGLPIESAASGQVDVPATVRSLTVLLERLGEHAAPVAAIVEGDARGAGVGLVAVADVVIARPEARFQLPEVYWGIIPAAVFTSIARRVGVARARRMALGDAPTTAADAVQCGLVDIMTTLPDVQLDIILARWRRAERRAVAAVRQLTARNWPVDDATETLSRLWERTGRNRIKQFVDGHAPWEVAG